jgi:hypothetical protein
MSDLINKIAFPGEVNVIAANLISHKGSVLDITSMIGDITIYEDMFSNTMSGYILVQDSLDLINTLPLIGQELFELELQTPTLKSSIKKQFYIYKLQHRTAKKRSQIYILKFCSKELIVSSNLKLAKAFSGNITDTVKTIFSDKKYIGSDTKLVTDKTKNSYSFIAPYWKPLETINWLTGKSVSERGSPNFLFFESHKSFNYVSIETLLSSIPVRDYVFADVDANTYAGPSGDIESKYNIVQSMNDATTFDYLRNLNAGMYASKLYTLDMTTKNININTFDYIDNFDKTQHLEKYPIKTNSLLRSKLANLYFIEKNNYQTGVFKSQLYNESFLQRNSLIEQLFAFKIGIKVFGRTDIKVGDTINFAMNEFREITKDEIVTSAKNDYYNGKYLITAIRHQILSGKHTMEMEIVSDSSIVKIS